MSTWRETKTVHGCEFPGCTEIETSIVIERDSQQTTIPRETLFQHAGVRIDYEDFSNDERRAIFCPHHWAEWKKTVISFGFQSASERYNSRKVKDPAP